jgi:hypothetical protein
MSCGPHIRSSAADRQTAIATDRGLNVALTQCIIQMGGVRPHAKKTEAKSLFGAIRPDPYHLKAKDAVRNRDSLLGQP